MAQGIGNFMDRVQIGTDEANQIAIGSSAYAVCSTAANNATKTVNIPGFTLNTGTTVHIKFTNTNSATSPTLNISNTGDIAIMQYGTTKASTTAETSGWQAGAVLTLTYDGTNWIRDQGYNTNTNTHNNYVNQNVSTTSSYRKVLMTGDTVYNTVDAPATERTAGVHQCTDVSIQPSTGTLFANIFSGSGISLTNLNASNISSGTVPIANLPVASTTDAGIIQIGTAATNAAAGNHTHSLNNLTKKALTTSTIQSNNTTDLIYSSSAGKFFGHTSNVDWVGLQISSSVDRFQLTCQLVADSNTLLFRQNDASSSIASNWKPWQQFVHTAFSNVGGAGTAGDKTSGFEAVATPVYVAQDGTATPIVYTIGSDVPIGAVFTDTTSFTITANASSTLWNLTGQDGTNEVTYSLAPYDNKQATAAFYTAATNPDLTTRLNYDGYFYATKLYSGGTEVLTAHQTYSGFTGKPTSNQTPGFGSTFTIQQIKQSTTGEVTATDRTVTIPNTIATYNALGLVSPAFVTSGSATGMGTAATRSGNVTVNARSSDNGRYYIVEADKDGRLFVNVPWTNVNNSYQTTLTFDGTYNASTNKAATVSTVTSAIEALDVSNITGFGTDQTLATLTETDGKIAATFQTIAFPVTSVNGKTGAITLDDLGLSKALRFIGITTSNMSDGFSDVPAGITNYTTPQVGDVVIDSDEDSEYVCTVANNGTYKWEYLGGDSSWAVANHTHTISLTQAGTATVTLAASTVYTLTAGGDSVVFKTPGDNDYRVRQAVSTDTGTYPLLISSRKTTDASNNTAYVAMRNNSIYVQPSSGTVYATTFTGDLTGTASNVTTTLDTSNTLYLVGVVSGATTTLKYDTGITIQNGVITATEFSGAVTGNVTGDLDGTALNATNDSDGNAINDTYFKLTETRAATTSNTFAITEDTDASSTATGALTVSGGVGIAKKLYVGTGIHVGNLTIGGIKDTDAGKTIESSSTLQLKTTNSTSVIFLTNSTGRARFDTSGHFRPEANATYNIGDSASYRWKNAYLTTSVCVGAKNTITAYNSNALGSFIGPGVISSCVTAAGNGYYLMGAAGQYARLYIQTIGTTSAGGETYLELGNATATGTAKNSRGCARIYHTNSAYTDYLANGILTNGAISDFTIVGATSNTANAAAWTNLILGNNAPVDTASNAHSQGNLRLYSSGSTYTDIQSQAGSSHIFYLPNYDDDMYAVHVGSTSAEGSNTQPVYIAANGLATALTYTQNRLYYSSSTTTFEETGHYATDEELAINKNSITDGYTLEVNGKTKLLDDLDLVSDFTITGDINPSTTNTYSLGTGGNSGQKRWSGVFIGTANTYGSTTQPVYWNNGVPEALIYTQNRLYYSASTSSFAETNHYASTTAVNIGSTSAPVSGSIFEVAGTSTMQEILPEVTNSYNLGSASLIWNNFYVETAYIRNINAGPLSKWTDGILSIGESNTKIIKVYYSGGSNAVEHLEINNKGAYVLTNLAVGSQESPTPSYTLYVDGTTKLISSVGIGTVIANNYILNVLGDMQIQGNIHPQSSPNTSGTIAYDLGSTSKRWNDIYLYNDINISNSSATNPTSILLSTGGSNINIAYSTASINLLVKNGNSAVSELTMTALKPIITLDTTATNKPSWTLENDSGTSKFTNGTTLLQGNDNGFQLNSNLYIAETVPSSNAYNLYVNGTTFHTDDVTFAPVTSTTSSSPQLIWSGASDGASIYYKILSTTEGRLIINTYDSNCLIGYTYNNSETMYMKTYSANDSEPSFYPANSNTGTLGLTTNKWKALYIGTENSYGDAYTPIYWNAGVPTAVVPIQYVGFTIASGQSGVKLSHATAFTTSSYVVQIVVTSGESNLSSPISWSSNVSGEISLTCTSAVADDVVGYILVARGGELTVTSEDIT